MCAYTGSFRGAGKTLTAAAISVLMLGVVRFPIVWIGAGELGESGIWMPFAISNVFGALLAYAWYKPRDVVGRKPRRVERRCR